MAGKFDNLTIDYQTLSAMPVSRRRELERQGMFDQMMAQLTPGQIAALFPQYYKDELNKLAGQKNESSKALTTGYQSNTSTKPTSTNATPARPVSAEDKRKEAVQTRQENAKKNAVSPSDFRKAESNPMLAGYLGNAKNADRFSRDGATPGLGNLRDKKARMKGVYDAFTSAGFSHKQALALTAEVGRENGFQDKYLFGTHSDPHNKVQNIGIFSFQGSRNDAIRKHMADKGMVDENGNFLSTQEALNEQAKFIKKEMETTESGPMMQEFLSNKDIGRDRAAELLGKGYIRWRFGDPAYASHHNTRNAFYSEIDQISAQFEPIPKDNALPVNAKGMEEGAINNVFDTMQRAEPLVPGADTILDYNKVHENQEETAAIRKLPIKQEVKDSLAYAASKNGVEVDIVSGGQLSERDGGLKGLTRTGSTRHDDGGAADLKLFVKDDKGNKRYLNMNNPEDKAIMKQFTVDAVASGMTGVGAGNGYMGSETLHIGLGKQTHWGGADWIGDALEQGVSQRFDLQKWKEEQQAKRDAEKAKAKKELEQKHPDPLVSEADKLVQGADPVQQTVTQNTETIVPVVTEKVVSSADDLIKQGEEKLANRDDVVKVEPKKEEPAKKPLPSYDQAVKDKTEPVKAEQTAAVSPEVKPAEKSTWETMKDNAGSWLGQPHAETSNAAGGFISEPHTAINNRTGDIINLGEKGTGGEMIVPQNKIDAAELSKNDFQGNNNVPFNQGADAGTKDKDVPTPVIQMHSPSTNMSQPTQTAVVPINHPRRNGSLMKAYARASMQPQIQQEGYVNYGHPLF